MLNLSDKEYNNLKEYALMTCISYKIPQHLAADLLHESILYLHEMDKTDIRNNNHFLKGIIRIEASKPNSKFRRKYVEPSRYNMELIEEVIPKKNDKPKNDLIFDILECCCEYYARHIMLMQMKRGYNLKEIAEITGINYKTIQRINSDTKDKLQFLINEIKRP